MIFGNVPALDISHRTRWVAPVRVRTQVNFKKPSQGSITRFVGAIAWIGDQLGDQDDERQSRNRLALENQGKFSGMFVGGSVGPQSLAKAQQLLVIRQLRGPDANIRHGVIVNESTAAVARSRSAP